MAVKHKYFRVIIFFLMLSGSVLSFAMSTPAAGTEKTEETAPATTGTAPQAPEVSGETASGLRNNSNNINRLLQDAYALELMRYNADRTLPQIFFDGLKKGALTGVERTAQEAVLNLFKFIPGIISSAASLKSVFADCMYSYIFGSYGLSWNGLAIVNNRIYYLCVPFANASSMTMDKQRRAQLIAQDGSEHEEQLTQSTWQYAQEALIIELYHASAYLKKTLPCYDLKYVHKSTLGINYRMAGLVQLFSAQELEQISFYIIRAIDCIHKLIAVLQSFKSFEDAQTNYNETKRWLSWTCHSFEQIAQFVDPIGAAQPRAGNRMQFAKITAQASGGSLNANLSELLGPSKMSELKR